jgi:hypothetical protein
MIEGTLHATPRERDVVLEQIRMTGLSLRREALIAAVVLGIVTIAIAVAIFGGNAESWFDGDPTFPLSLPAFLLPFAVWRGERRFGPAFLWTLPVDRRRLALAKVFAGWVWLIAALTGFMLWWFGLALIAGATVTFPSVAVVTATYLLGSALVLGLRHPLRWLLAAAAVFFLLGFFNQRVDTLLNASSFVSAMERATTVWQTLSPLAQWAIPTFLSLGAGVAALWAAISRHRETR